MQKRGRIGCTNPDNVSRIATSTTEVAEPSVGVGPRTIFHRFASDLAPALGPPGGGQEASTRKDWRRQLELSAVMDEIVIGASVVAHGLARNRGDCTNCSATAICLIVLGRDDLVWRKELGTGARKTRSRSRAEPA